MRSRTLPAASAPSTAKYLCLIVLDGGKPEYITNNIKSLPNVQKLMNSGRWYNRAFVGSLMSITPPGVDVPPHWQEALRSHFGEAAVLSGA